LPLSGLSWLPPHFGAFDQNIFTEWHSRYGGRGVLIYWHVERGSVVVHSQHLTCSASVVHALVEGAIRHGTSMSIEANYTDSPGLVDQLWAVRFGGEGAG